MFGKKAFRGAEVSGHLAVVPNVHMIFVYADLDGIAGGIILVNHRVQQDFSESFAGEHENFDPLDAVIGDPGFHVFGINQVDGSVDLLNQRAVNFYVREYGFAARKIDDNRDYLMAFLFGTEYNLSDAAGFYIASMKYQDGLIKEALDHPITEIVTSMDIPVYFVMGKYDGMTSPEAAEEYLNGLGGEGVREILIFEESAHYPQFEEKLEFSKWMRGTFTGE